MKFRLPTAFPKQAIVPAVFAGTGLLCLLLSIWTAHAIERFSKLGVRRAMSEAGLSWAEVEADGLQVILTGTAPTEAMRFRALAVAGNVVDSARLRDAMAIADQAAIDAPDFKIEVLRNDDGISLIGLAPAQTDRAAIVETLDALAEGDQVTDMLETSDHPVPPGWESAVAFAETALKSLPRSKISITPGRVAVTAISDSAAQKQDIEARLRRLAPSGLQLALDISAPRPVITPFTLRFLIDEEGPRFDACSADSDKSSARILAAARAAGAAGDATCTVGLGVPTPEWADAAMLGIAAVKSLGNGSITFSDVDVALEAGPGVSQAAFDAAVGELESNLPKVFSLKATQSTAAEGGTAEAEFVGTLSPDGEVTLSGRVTDELTRDAVESFAHAQFGTKAVHAATRLDANLPTEWPTRVLVGLEALAQLHSGKVTVGATSIRIEGKSGSKDAAATVARILTAKLGENAKIAIAVKYDKELDPQVDLPTDQECLDQINAALAEHKITFEPGSAIVTPDAKATIDKIANIMKGCADYPMEVGGHTDSQGREEMNLALSEQRARAVIVALQSRRVLTGNLSAKGYGETVPIMANDTEADREKNRRIEFRLLNPSASAGSADAAATPAATDPAAIEVKTPDKATIRPKPRPDSN